VTVVDVRALEVLATDRAGVLLVHQKGLKLLVSQAVHTATRDHSRRFETSLVVHGTALRPPRFRVRRVLGHPLVSVAVLRFLDVRLRQVALAAQAFSLDHADLVARFAERWPASIFGVARATQLARLDLYLSFS
jgi:hypothetical protein